MFWVKTVVKVLSNADLSTELTITTISSLQSPFKLNFRVFFIARLISLSL